MSGKQAAGLGVFVLACLALIVTVVVSDDTIAAPSEPQAAPLSAVQECQRVADQWERDHRAVVDEAEAVIVCVPGEEITDRGGWRDAQYAFINAYEDRPDLGRVWSEHVIAHEVGHVWQAKNVPDLTAYAAVRMTSVAAAVEDYADVFAYSLGFDYRTFWPDRELAGGVPTPEQISALREAGLLPH